MKVQIKPVSNGYFSFKCVKYREGDILEVDPQDFNPEVMESLPEIVVVPIVQVDGSIVQFPYVEVVEKPKRKRKVTVVESPPETI
jgi:hypothetical protein